MKAKITIIAVTMAGIGAFLVQSARADVFYVNHVAGGTGSGDSWQNAFTDLQSALEAADNDPGTDEIWVAAGTYLPSKRHEQSNAPRTETFELIANTKVFGGFAGTESQRAACDAGANQGKCFVDHGLRPRLGVFFD